MDATLQVLELVSKDNEIVLPSRGNVHNHPCRLNLMVYIKLGFILLPEVTVLGHSQALMPP